MIVYPLIQLQVILISKVIFSLQTHEPSTNTKFVKHEAHFRSSTHVEHYTLQGQHSKTDNE
jgi:hypothetical protein